MTEKQWLLKQLVKTDFVNNPKYGARIDNISCARFLADVYGNKYRYCVEVKEREKKFFRYLPRRGIWEQDIKNTFSSRCMEFTDALEAYCLNLINDPEWLPDKSKGDREEAQRKALAFAHSLSKRDPRNKLMQDVGDLTAFSKEELDGNPDYVNCLDGVIDTATGDILKHDPGLLMSKCTRVHLHGERDGDRFVQFLDEIQQGDKEMIRFIQQVLGSGLVYGNRNEEFFILHGASTRNGKSTLLDAVSYVLGDYAKAADFKTFSEQGKNSDSSKPTPDLARLYNARFVTVSEPSKTMSLDAARLKQLTGGNTIVTRGLNEAFFEYTAEFKLFFDTNYYPHVNDRTIFSSDRVVVIPFDRHFSKTEIDPTLKQRFRKPETVNFIFWWLFDGLKLSRTAEFKKRPQKVEDAIHAYEMHEDAFGDFTEECLVPDSNVIWKNEHKPSRIPLSVLYKLYEDWCGKTGRRAVNKSGIRDQLQARRIYQKSGKINGVAHRDLCIGYLVKNEAWQLYTNQYDRDEIKSYVLTFAKDFHKYADE